MRRFMCLCSLIGCACLSPYSQIAKAQPKVIVVGKSGYIATYSVTPHKIVKTTEAQLFLPRNKVVDASLSLDNKRLAVVVAMNPPLRLINADSLEESRRFDDKLLIPKVEGNVMPVFCIWLTNSSLLYQDERTEVPRILDLTGGLTRPATGLQIYGKDEAILSPDSQTLLSLRFWEVYVYDISSFRTVFSASLFNKGELWWPVSVTPNWTLSQVGVLYKITNPPADRPPVHALVDWRSGEVEKSDGEVPDIVRKALNSEKAKNFVLAYGYGRGRGKGVFPVIYGPIEKALSTINNASFEKISQDPQLAFVTHDGKTAALVHYSGESGQEACKSVIRFLNLETGIILNEIRLDEKVLRVIFSSSFASR